MAEIVRATNLSPEKRLLFGYRFDPVRMDEAVARCRNALVTRQQMLIGVLNASKIVASRHDHALRRSLLDCDLLLADGQSIVWAGKLLGSPLPERVAGIDLFERLLRLANNEHRSVYLLGARPSVLKTLEERIAQRFPDLRIAGSHDGYFDDSDSDRIARDIRESGADMLFIGMSSPRKEQFLHEHGRSLGVPVLHGVGGSFDVLAGLTRRAPRAWQRLGMEWAYRVLQEPQRLWWRYLSTNTAFVMMTLAEFTRPTRAFDNSGMTPPSGSIRQV